MVERKGKRAGNGAYQRYSLPLASTDLNHNGCQDPPGPSAFANRLFSLLLFDYDRDGQSLAVLGFYFNRIGDNDFR